MRLEKKPFIDEKNYTRPERRIHQNPDLDKEDQLANYLDKQGMDDNAAQFRERLEERATSVEGVHTIYNVLIIGQM
eukprot:3181614-Karenia_brevis.AAC.1